MNNGRTTYKAAQNPRQLSETQKLMKTLNFIFCFCVFIRHSSGTNNGGAQLQHLLCRDYGLGIQVLRCELPEPASVVNMR